MAERQKAHFNKIYAYKFDKLFPQYKNTLYCDFSNNIKPTGLENLSDSQIYSTIQGFDGKNISEEKMSKLLTETYLRLKQKEQCYPADTIEFVNDNNGSFGMHYWANVVSDKMAINIYNPQKYYEDMSKYDATYNKENIGMCVLSTMIHETAHDTQCVKINKMLNGEELSPADRVMALTYLSSTCNLIEIPYTNQYIEFDANYKAITDIYDHFSTGKIKNSFNNKLNLYNDILIVLHAKKEDIIEDNTMYYEDLKNAFSKVDEPKIQKMVSQIKGSDKNDFAQEVDNRYKTLNQIRKQLEKDFIKNLTSDMSKIISKNKENSELIKSVISSEEYNGSNCLKFKQLLGKALQQEQKNQEEICFK